MGHIFLILQRSFGCGNHYYFSKSMITIFPIQFENLSYANIQPSQCYYHKLFAKKKVSCIVSTGALGCSLVLPSRWWHYRQQPNSLIPRNGRAHNLTLGLNVNMGVTDLVVGNSTTASIQKFIKKTTKKKQQKKNNL